MSRKPARALTRCIRDLGERMKTDLVVRVAGSGRPDNAGGDIGLLWRWRCGAGYASPSRIDGGRRHGFRVRRELARLSAAGGAMWPCGHHRSRQRGRETASRRSPVAGARVVYVNTGSMYQHWRRVGAREDDAEALVVVRVTVHCRGRGATRAEVEATPRNGRPPGRVEVSPATGSSRADARPAGTLGARGAVMEGRTSAIVFPGAQGVRRASSAGTTAGLEARLGGRTTVRTRSRARRQTPGQSPPRRAGCVTIRRPQSTDARAYPPAGSPGPRSCAPAGARRRPRGEVHS